MKLFIKRNQKAMTGVFGGHKGMSFILSCRLEFTPDEEELMTKYKAGDEPLLVVGDELWTPNNLKRGASQVTEGITILLENEEKIKEACKNFKLLLDVMATFGGEEVIEF